MRLGMILALFFKRLRALKEALLEVYATDTVSGALVSFADGAAGLPPKRHILSVQAAQEAGTPHPQYPRQMSSRSGAKIVMTGKNLAYRLWDSCTENGVTVEKLSPGVYRVDGTATANVALVIDLEANLPAGTYTISANNDKTALGTFLVGVTNTNTGDASAKLGSALNATCTYQSAYPINKFYLLVTRNSKCDNITIKVQIEAGSTATEFEPPRAAVSSLSWENEAGGIWGGTLDLIGGELKVTHGCIESYNGETIAEPWRSSKDVYSVGGTPTTGAQVVYPLAEPQSFCLAPLPIALPGGLNCLWSDAGEMEIVYRADTALYIQKKLAEQAAQEE